MKTIHPPETLSYNQWMIYIYQQLNYPINDDGTKKTATKGTGSQIRVGESPQSLRPTGEDRANKKANRRGKS